MCFVCAKFMNPIFHGLSRRCDKRKYIKLHEIPNVLIRNHLIRESQTVQELQHRALGVKKHGTIGRSYSLLMNHFSPFYVKRCNEVVYRSWSRGFSTQAYIQPIALKIHQMVPGEIVFDTRWVTYPTVNVLCAATSFYRHHIEIQTNQFDGVITKLNKLWLNKLINKRKKSFDTQV